ncbi:MAG: hypothetical protein DI573_12090 [Microbacterium sp.]|nr:MAG: hypothetical protein DI573_12090 [Microbacterium sp.]
MTSPSTDTARFVVVGRADRDVVALVFLDGVGRELRRRSVARDGLGDVLGDVLGDAATAPRIVWGDTALWYPDILAAGRRVERCHDLRLCHAILAAAATGEQGGVVSTWWGRTSPPPLEAWRELQSRAHALDATPADEAIARRTARDRGRFTRNFVVQGTAAEWALVWLADLRARLRTLTRPVTAPPARASGPAFAHDPHLVFWLHDEVIVHTPEELAEAVADAVREAAASAGRLLFGDFPLDFPLDLRISRTAGKD